MGGIHNPDGFNVSLEHGGELVLGEMPEKDIFRFEMTDMVVRAVDALPGFQKCDNPSEREEEIKRNMREILQLFNIRVLIYRERVEIKGAIPTQILDKTTKEEPESRSALIISSPSPSKERGRWL